MRSFDISDAEIQFMSSINARDTERFRKRRRTRKMQAVLAEAQKMILNKS